MTVDALALKIGRTPEFVRKIESGETRRLVLDDVAALSAALGVDFTVLVKRRGSKDA